MSRIILLLLLLVTLLASRGTLQAQDTYNATLVGTYLKDFQVDALVQDDTMLYFASIEWIFAVSNADPVNLMLIDTLNWYANPPALELMMDMTIHNGMLVCVALRSGFRIVDISDPSNMKMRASFEYPHRDFPKNVYGWNNYLYTVAYDSIFVLDISDIERPSKKAAYYKGRSIIGDPPGSPVFIEDSTIFFAAKQPILNWLGWDSLEVSTINFDGTINRPGRVYATPLRDDIYYVYKSDSLLFIGQTGAVHLTTYSKDGSLQKISSMPLRSNPVAIRKVGEYVYILADHAATLSVFDIHDINNPVQIASYYDPYAIEFRKFGINGDCVYIASATGLQIVKIHFPVSVPPPHTPASLALSPAYPNPVASGSAATVEFALPASGYITLTLCNTLGQELRRLEKRLEPGTHLERISTSGLNPGVYYYTLTAEGKRNTEMLVVR